MHDHLVFSTKDRGPLINLDIQPRLYDYLGGILRATDCNLSAAGGMPDHVHLLIRVSKQVAVPDLFRIVKTNSSKWIHETFPPLGGFAWQAGYGAFSVSYSHLSAVEEYLSRQAEHHVTVTFQDEFVTFLERYGIEYDPRYLWD